MDLFRRLFLGADVGNRAVPCWRKYGATVLMFIGIASPPPSAAPTALPRIFHGRTGLFPEDARGIEKPGIPFYRDNAALREHILPAETAERGMKIPGEKSSCIVCKK
ncbi:MAG: hypothetical protein JW913_00855 [Chitinispirillaceae bacterium]|nr:hypothetical protein [Chitinispirillaceae bacterium]